MNPGEPLGAGIRIFAVSDLHVDYSANMDWVKSLPGNDHTQDILIVAGDVTHDLERLKSALGSLREKFARVCYVPGNHEMWIDRQEWQHSLEKFHEVMALCRSLQVNIEPERVSGPGGSAVWVVPLYSWYVMPEEGEGSLYAPKPGEDPNLRMWADRYYVKWPSQPSFPRAADYFLQLNETWIQEPFDAPVVSFSHFLPRADLMQRTPMEKNRYGHGPRDPHPEFNFSRVAGCSALDDQLRRLGSSVHVYGHQHRNRWRSIEGVLYVSNCLGYPHAAAERDSFSRLPWQVWGDRLPAP